MRPFTGLTSSILKTLYSSVSGRECLWHDLAIIKIKKDWIKNAIKSHFVRKIQCSPLVREIRFSSKLMCSSLESWQQSSCSSCMCNYRGDNCGFLFHYSQYLASYHNGKLSLDFCEYCVFLRIWKILTTSSPELFVNVWWIILIEINFICMWNLTVLHCASAPTLMTHL